MLSAAMDTVTEARPGNCPRPEGGIGFIHKTCPLSAGAEEVRVKKHESGVDVTRRPSCQPITYEVKALTERNGFAGYPVW
ncbi:IMP dehydrogenase [Salmonella enterica subsp. enterica]|nr:IMP dehydrogenase [Salmonella enterica subsp. enterica]